MTLTCTWQTHTHNLCGFCQPVIIPSAEAFINLSKCFKEQNKMWLAEDKVAQQKRHNNPGAMDIYDTSKSQALTWASIQQVLILEEDEEGTIHGQTSWLSYLQSDMISDYLAHSP
ncbi:hypothetical protein V8E53_015478 [Lactarius tabidus]